MFWAVSCEVTVQGFRDACEAPAEEKQNIFCITVLFGVIIVLGWWMIRLTLTDCTFLTNRVNPSGQCTPVV